MSMDTSILTAENVLAAFADKKSGVVAAAAEFGISRSAICQWKKHKPIPAERRLHLYLHRPDIIEKVRAKQGATEQESQGYGSKDASSDDAQATACPRTAISQASGEGTNTHGGDSAFVGG
jgi:hypothetical protein